jgi:hypothetical protein
MRSTWPAYIILALGALAGCLYEARQHNAPAAVWALIAMGLGLAASYESWQRDQHR